MAPHADHDHTDDHQQHTSTGNATTNEETVGIKPYLPAIISFSLLMLGIALDNFLKDGYNQYLRIVIYACAYIPVGWPVIKQAIATVKKGDIFTEFLLMVLATLGAFALGEYPEAVAVMLFYAVGELFQDAAVNKAKRNIKALLDVRPSTAALVDGTTTRLMPSGEVEIGQTIQVKPGEKVPLDGELLSEQASFNTAALTGESKPRTLRKGEAVLAGMLNLDKVITLVTTKKFEDSALSKILALVQDATSKKANTELLIRRFARIYTPIVFCLAIALVVVPYFVVPNYVFATWLYRALVFLVISCPCALVISIPLGYFGGIGAASANGILFKGSNYLDLITKVNTVVMDKTGTLTHGVFKVQDIKTAMPLAAFSEYLASIEAQSNHPIAKAIVAYHGEKNLLPVQDLREIAGHGLSATINNKAVLAGNGKLLKQFNVSYPNDVDSIVETIVLMAIDGVFAGYITIADEIKEDAATAITSMHAAGVTSIVMLSGDKTSITQKVAGQLGLDEAYGDLLPEGKVERLEAIKADKTKVVAFVGDGINDAPVLALSDIGMAMGALGSDVAIETADVVIQNDMPSKITTAIKIGLATKSIVYQNITLAFAVKAVVLVLGAGGLATMWEAVFADVGVAFLAILNAVRIQKMKF